MPLSIEVAFLDTCEINLSDKNSPIKEVIFNHLKDKWEYSTKITYSCCPLIKKVFSINK